ncbi:MAG: glycoside hydrolase family 19 protein, partial [Flavisolibacter sp.]|nr:glycoside hydrolase family 19 protein [Flavisolibacter sp.]
MMNLPDAPDLLTNVWYGLLGAFIEWTNSNCNELADVDDIKGIIKRINGGLIGLEGRRAWLAEWKHALRNNEPVVSADESGVG